MTVIDSGSKRSLTVLAVVVACFAVLWPKIFYPMIESILFPTDDEELQETSKKVNYDEMLNPQMREAMGEARPSSRVIKERNKGLFHPSLRHATKPQTKGAGAINLVIPVYTIIIIIFFLYSLLKISFKNNTEISSKSLCQNSFCKQKRLEADELLNKSKEIPSERKTQRALEQYGKDKVLTALKTIIFEMEDMKGTFSEVDMTDKQYGLLDGCGQLFWSSLYQSGGKDIQRDHFQSSQA